MQLDGISKVCWKITTSCNQKCQYCFGFSNVPELTFEKNKIVLNNLIESGIQKITWTGGEAILYPYLDKLMELAKMNGVENKLVTNGIFLAENTNEYTERILNNLDYLTLSIDSISNNINNKLGKVNQHFETIKKVLEYVKAKSVKININTVVSTKNAKYLDELGNFLNNYNINHWKLLKFMPIRKRALQNKQIFDIKNVNMEQLVQGLKKFENIHQITYKNQKELEKSIVILPNGTIIKTIDSCDVILGNALNIIKEKRREDTMKKIRTFIALKDESERNTVVNLLNNLNYVDVIGSTNNGQDALDKIVALKPEVVFADYKLDGLNGLEIMKFSKEKMQSELPSFNIITDVSLYNKTEEIIKTVGINFNSLIESKDTNKILNIIEEYKKD